jgi:hypothetical protein
VLIFEVCPRFVTVVALVVGVMPFIMDRQATARNGDAAGPDHKA